MARPHPSRVTPFASSRKIQEACKSKAGAHPSKRTSIIEFHLEDNNQCTVQNFLDLLYMVPSGWKCIGTGRSIEAPLARTFEFRGPSSSESRCKRVLRSWARQILNSSLCDFVELSL